MQVFIEILASSSPTRQAINEILRCRLQSAQQKVLGIKILGNVLKA
jgi:hypothetical protein